MTSWGSNSRTPDQKPREGSISCCEESGPEEVVPRNRTGDLVDDHSGDSAPAERIIIVKAKGAGDGADSEMGRGKPIDSQCSAEIKKAALEKDPDRRKKRKKKKSTDCMGRRKHSSDEFVEDEIQQQSSLRVHSNPPAMKNSENFPDVVNGVLEPSSAQNSDRIIILPAEKTEGSVDTRPVNAKQDVAFSVSQRTPNKTDYSHVIRAADDLLKGDIDSIPRKTAGNHLPRNEASSGRHQESSPLSSASPVSQERASRSRQRREREGKPTTPSRSRPADTRDSLTMKPSPEEKTSWPHKSARKSSPSVEAHEEERLSNPNGVGRRLPATHANPRPTHHHQKQQHGQGCNLSVSNRRPISSSPRRTTLGSPVNRGTEPRTATMSAHHLTVPGRRYFSTTRLTAEELALSLEEMIILRLLRDALNSGDGQSIAYIQNTIQANNEEQWIHLYNLLEPRHRKILSNPTIRRKSPQPEKQAKSVGRAGDHHIHTPIVVNHSHASSAFSRPAPLGASRDQEDEKEVQRSMQQQEEEKEIVESVRETLVLDQCKAEVERERETARPSARMRAIGTVTNTGKGRSSRKAKWVDASPAARDAQQQMPAGVPASDDVAAREVMLLQHRCHLLQRELDKINGAKPGVSHKATLMKDPARADVKLPHGVEELTSHGRTKPRRDRKHTGPSRKRHGAVTIQHKHRGLVDGTTDLELDFEDPDLQQLLADYADLARQYARVHSAVTNAEDILHGAKIGCRYVPLGAGSDSQWEWGKLQQKPVCGSPDTSITRCRPSWDCESVPSRSPERPWLASPSSGDANRFSLNRSWSSHQHLAGPLGNDPRYEGSVRRSTADIYSGASPTPAWTPWSPRRCHPSPHRHRAMDWRPRQNTTSASSYKPTAAILQTELLEDGLAKVERELNLLSTTLNQCRRAVSAW